uniref:Uncharacterized protein n=1 Tax=Toxoplasma gondii (strain ATCC 50861 / VEG) TaxID=432359 RepID=A0A0F7V806_TOXGV|nr:TPA: hypothetical protein BN1205_002755 [Toxoplasma gondii VEG]
MLRGERMMFNKVTVGCLLPLFPRVFLKRTCSLHSECVITRSGGFVCRGHLRCGRTEGRVIAWDGINTIRSRNVEASLTFRCSWQWELESPRRGQRTHDATVSYVPRIVARYGPPSLPENVEERRIGTGVSAVRSFPNCCRLSCGVSRATLHSFSHTANPQDGREAQSVTKADGALNENKLTRETPDAVSDTLRNNEGLGQENDQKRKKAEELAENARMAESLWQTFVPERSWGLTSPVFWVLLVAVIALHEINEKRDRERANSRTAADETEANLREEVEKARARRRREVEN